MRDIFYLFEYGFGNSPLLSLKYYRYIDLHLLILSRLCLLILVHLILLRLAH